MKEQFCVLFVFSVLLESTNEQCPLSVENSTITSCEGSRKYGSNIYIDFNAISRPCTCTALPSFDGELLLRLASGKVTYDCGTQIQIKNINNTTVTLLFGCPIDSVAFNSLNVQINQSVDIRAEYVSPFTSGMFLHCLVFQQNGGSNGNLSVICGSPPGAAATTISTTNLTSTQLSHASTPTEPSIETTTTSTSVVNTIENTDATRYSNTNNVSHESLSMESTRDNPEMLFIIAGSAGGGAIVLVGLIVFILVLINRTRSASNKNGPSEADMARTNEVFDSNPELPDNPLYLSSQPMDELGYSSDQEKQLGLPPTDSKPKKKIIRTMTFLLTINP